MESSQTELKAYAVEGDLKTYQNFNPTQIFPFCLFVHYRKTFFFNENKDRVKKETFMLATVGIQTEHISIYMNFITSSWHRKKSDFRLMLC